MERLLALIDDVYKYVDDVVVSRMLLAFLSCSYFLHFVFSGLYGKRASQYSVIPILGEVIA